MASNYNSLPENAVELVLTNSVLKDMLFSPYPIQETEFRQVPYDANNFTSGLYDLKILWVDKASGLGYGIGDHWKTDDLICYRFGSEEAWTEHRRKVAEANY